MLSPTCGMLGLPLSKSLSGVQALSSKEAELLKDNLNAEKYNNSAKQTPGPTDVEKTVSPSAGEVDVPSLSSVPSYSRLEAQQKLDTFASPSGTSKSHLLKYGDRVRYTGPASIGLYSSPSSLSRLGLFTETFQSRVLISFPCTDSWVPASLEPMQASGLSSFQMDGSRGSLSGLNHHRVSPTSPTHLAQRGDHTQPTPSAAPLCSLLLFPIFHPIRDARRCEEAVGIDFDEFGVSLQAFSALIPQGKKRVMGQ